MKKKCLALCLSLALLLPTASALTVEQARTLVERLYINDIPQELLDKPTVEELFAGLDVYSTYFTPEEYEAFLYTMNDVPQVGLGIVSARTEDGSALEIARVLEGGAAEKAGVLPGDRITAIDGRPVADAADLAEVTGWMRGEEGTDVTLALTRADGRTETLTLTRTVFVIPHTTHALVDGHIGYIDCDSFGTETYDHFTAAADELDGQVNLWLVDLRGNTGGLTQAATNAAGLFSGSGTKAILQQRNGDLYGFVSEEERSLLDPVILLVDGMTASASELFASSIRDSEVGLIIGSRTFGKGVVQTVVDQTSEPSYFPDGDAVRITSARFYSSNGICNDRMGVLPHLLVADEYAADIAYLLAARDPGAQNDGYLRIHAGSWRWYLSLDQALEEGYRPVFVELLEALWPDATLYLGAGDDQWETLSPTELAGRLGLSEYFPRSFSDVADSPHAYSLNVLGTYGILQGDENGNVNPQAQLTRADLCAMLAQTLNTAGPTGRSCFSDVAPDAWYAPAVNTMAELGFISGDGTGNFRPEAPLTNEQMAVILARFTTWLNLEMNLTAKEGPTRETLADPALATYSDWATESAWLLGLSRHNMFGNPISYLSDPIGELDPQAPATRECAAASLFRILTLLGGLVD